MIELLESLSRLLASGFMPGVIFLLFASLALGGVLIVVSLSIARHVALNKHREWKYRDAFDYVAWHGFVELAIFLPAVALVWLAPKFIPLPFSESDLRGPQLAITAILVIAVNLHFYGFVLRHISRPPRD
jgi:hypothetical protein